MADGERKLRLKHAHETRDLSYGHFGSARFDGYAEDWRFLRRSLPARVDDDGRVVRLNAGFNLLSERRLFLPPKGIDEVKQQHFSEGQAAPRPLRLSYPELAFIPESILQQRDLSESPSENVQNPAMSRLAFGLTSPVSTHGYHAEMGQPFLAAIVPVDGSKIVVAPVGSRMLSVNDESGIMTKIEGPGLSSALSALDLPYDEPVLQVIFQHTGRLLATRQPSGTTFWVLDKSRLISSAQSMRAKAILTVQKSRTGGYSHAHVAFHPTNARKVGIIDCHGNWSVWSLSGVRPHSMRPLFQAELKFCGKISSWQHLPKREDADHYDDGWHRACWVADEETGREELLVCNRRHAEVYNRIGEFRCRFDLRLGRRSKANWALDVQQSKACASVCFILTTTRIMAVTFDGLDDSGDKGSGLCSWNHFRGHANLDLKMSLLETNNVVYAFVYSSTSTAVTLNTFGLRTGGETDLHSAADPITFKLPPTMSESSRRVTELAFQAFETHRERKAAANSEHPCLVQMIASLDDGVLLEAVYEINADLAASEAGKKNRAALPLWSKSSNIKSSQHVTETDDEQAELDMLIVDDQTGGPTHLTLAEPEIADLLAIVAPSAGAPRFKNWPDLLKEPQEIRREWSIEDALCICESRLTDESNHASPTKLLKEILTDVRISDVDTDSEALTIWKDFRSGTINDHGATAVDNVFGLTDVLLVNVYDELFERDIQSLPEDLPDRIRVQTERLTRNIALDVTASSYVVSLRRMQGEVPSISGLKLDDEATERDMPDSDQVTAAATRLNTAAAALAHLSKYTTFSQPVSRSLQNRSVQDILAHLPTDPSADPDHYSYRDVERELAQARNVAQSESMDARERRRAEKLVLYNRRRLEWQKRQRELASEQGTVPTVAQSGQPKGPDWDSQQASAMRSSPDLQTMTQPVPGAYGGRKEQKIPRRKGRAAGF